MSIVFAEGVQVWWTTLLDLDLEFSSSHRGSYQSDKPFAYVAGEFF